jgi:hypothetical protein
MEPSAVGRDHRVLAGHLLHHVLPPKNLGIPARGLITLSYQLRRLVRYLPDSWDVGAAARNHVPVEVNDSGAAAAVRIGAGRAMRERSVSAASVKHQVNSNSRAFDQYSCGWRTESLAA